MRLTIIFVSLVAAAALLVAGCGDGGDASGSGGGDASGSTQDTTSAAPLTKAQLIKQGDKICSRSSGRILNELQRHKTDYGRGFGNVPTKKQNEEGLVDLVLPLIRKEAGEIAELNPPPADVDEIEAIVEALEAGADKTEAKPSLAEARGASNPLVKASTLSQAYGFKVCGS